MSIDKNYLALLSVIYSLQNQNQTTQVCFRINTYFSIYVYFFPTVSPLLIKKNLKESWSQNECGLIRYGLIICIGTARMLPQRPSFKFTLLEVNKESQVGILKASITCCPEAKKPLPKKLSTRFHLQDLWYIVVTSLKVFKTSLGSCHGSDLPYQPDPVSEVPGKHCWQ